jgi:hypothetical protein
VLLVAPHLVEHSHSLDYPPLAFHHHHHLTLHHLMCRHLIQTQLWKQRHHLDLLVNFFMRLCINTTGSQDKKNTCLWFLVGDHALQLELPAPHEM